MLPDDQELLEALLDVPLPRRMQLLIGGLRTLPSAQLCEVLECVKPRLDPVAVLPTEVVLRIFSFLDTDSLRQTNLVSRAWRAVGRELFKPVRQAIAARRPRTATNSV